MGIENDAVVPLSQADSIPRLVSTHRDWKHAPGRIFRRHKLHLLDRHEVVHRTTANFLVTASL